MLVWSENEKTSIYSGREFPSEWNKFFVNKKIILIIKPCQDRMPFHVKVSFFSHSPGVVNDSEEMCCILSSVSDLSVRAGELR